MNAFLDPHQTLQTRFGLTLTYDGSHTIKVWISAAYKENTCGLCGTFDDDKSNEFRLNNGSLVSMWFNTEFFVLVTLCINIVRTIFFLSKRLITEAI